ncbi:MAG: hypothetical protein CL404_07030 [Acidimicrobiaceae bacterium]|nr:hypothetical protein [Acidimicrobiaceae bacterium]
MSTPLGTSIEKVFSAFSRPVPSHESQGFIINVPKPWQDGHAIVDIICPRIDWRTCWSCPCPSHRLHNSDSLLWLPLPVQVSHSRASLRVNSTSPPFTTCSKVILRAISTSSPEFLS